MRATIASVLLLFLAVGCSHNTDLTKVSSQEDFGVQAAKMNLWREALFRFQRAVQINPEDAMAHNNLAVAYEANGDFEKARKEYLEALKLDKSNQYIQKNYSRFVEFLSRNKKRQQQKPLTAGGTPPSSAPPNSGSVVAPPITTTPLVPPPAAPPSPAPPPGDSPGGHR